MKNSTAPNRKLGRMIAKNLIILLTVVIAGFCGIQAWFTDKQSAEADGIQVQCTTPDGIEIAIVKHDDPAPTDDQYKTGTIELTKKDYPWLEDIKMTEISSDGYTFYKPALKQENGVAKPILDANWELGEANIHYLSFDLYIRSKSAYDIYIDKTSKISPNASVLTGANAVNKSDFGENGTSGGISRDCVTGAVRFSINNYQIQERKLLWIPAPNIYLTANSDTTQYSVDINKSSGDSYVHNYYVQESGVWKEKSVTTGDLTGLGSVFVANSNGFDSDGNYTYQLGSKREIVTLKKETIDAEYATGMVTCNMWVDGEDAEARLALINGKFKASLVLTKDNSN